MKKFFLYLNIVIFLSACANSAQIGGTCIDLNVESSKKIVLQDLVDKISFIPLENNTNCILTSPSRIEYFNDEYYILDNRNKILVFDEKGSFKRSVGVKGKGHGEYSILYDFTIDKDNKKIILLCENSTVYSYEINGKFKEKKKICESLLWNIASCKSGYLLTSNHLTYVNGDNAYLFFQFDKSFNLVNKDIRVLPKQMYMPTLVSSNLQSCLDELRYCDIYTNKMYIFDRNFQSNKMYDFKLQNPMPYENFVNQNSFMSNMNRYDYIIDNISLRDRIITFYTRNGIPRLALSSLNGENIIQGEYYGIMPKLQLIQGENIISIVNSEEMGKFNRDNQIQSLTDSLKMDPNGNAYIFKFHLRDQYFKKR